MKKNQVILIYGAPASGKYTMAKRLADKNGVLLDNHYFHDMFKDLIEVPEDQKNIYFENVGVLKASFLNIIKLFYPKNKFVRYIFTSCFTKDEGDKPLKLQNLAENLNADFIPIELRADTEVLKKRCQTEYRKWRKKISDPEKLERIVQASFTESPLYEHKNKILINTSYLSEDETFEKIQSHLKNFE